MSNHPTWLVQVDQKLPLSEAPGYQQATNSPRHESPTSNYHLGNIEHHSEKMKCIEHTDRAEEGESLLVEGEVALLYHSCHLLVAEGCIEASHYQTHPLPGVEHSRAHRHEYNRRRYQTHRQVQFDCNRELLSGYDMLHPAHRMRHYPVPLYAHIDLLC